MHPFEVMAEPVRRRIIDILASGEHTSGELADVIGMEYRISASAVSKHLRRMLDAGFVEVRADMSKRVYRLSEDGLGELEDEVADLRKKFDERIGWFGPGERFIAGVPLKGVGRPGRRGGRGKGVAADPWRKWTTPEPFPAGGRSGISDPGGTRDAAALVALVDLEELDDLDGPIRPGGPAGQVGGSESDAPGRGCGEDVTS